MPNAIDARTHFIEMPPEIPAGFPVTQVLSKEGSELAAPFTQGFVADLDDDHGEPVAVKLGVGYGASTYPNPIKETQSSSRLYALDHPRSRPTIFPEVRTAI